MEKKYYAEMSITTDINHTSILEYRIPEILLLPQSENRRNIIQFRIPILQSTTIENIMKQVVEETTIVTGNTSFPEDLLSTLREDTKKCIDNYTEW